MMLIMITAIRPELAGKDYSLIEFLLARVADDMPTSTGAEKAHLEEILGVLDGYQDVEIRLLQRRGDVTELLSRAVGYATICREYAREWSQHRDFHPDWNAP